MFIIMPKSSNEVRSKKNIWKCMFAPRNSRLQSLRLSLFRHIRECKITWFSYRSDNITKRMEFMHPRVRTTSAFEQEKSAEVISPLSRVCQTPSAFPSWHETLSFPRFRFPPSPFLFPQPLIYFTPFPLILLFARPSLISLLQVRDSWPMGKPGSNEKGD